MKKKLVVLLAVVMMFAFSASAYAAVFSDLDEQPVVVQDAVAKAVALGIIDGYADGTYGPNQTITRAEFAKIAVTAAGAKDTATMLEKNASSFKDVKANSWYTGWINAGESLGIFQGDPDGKFRPNDTISNQEVITVLMRLLGYNDNLPGTWPVNYVTKANQVEMLDDVNIVATAPANRADVAVMLNATLDTNIVTYDKDTNEFVLKQYKISDSHGITLLQDSFKGSFVTVDGSDDAVDYQFPAVEQVRDANALTLNWNVDKTYIIDNQTYVSHNGGSLFDLEGHQGKIYFVREGSKYYARFIEVKSYTKTATDTVKYDGKKVTVLKTTYNAATKVYENRHDAESFSIASGNLDDKIEADKYFNSNVVMYFNDDDQVYQVRSDKDFTDPAFVVTKTGTNTVRLVGNTNKTANIKDGATVIFDKTAGKFIAPSELKAGDVLVEIVVDDLYVKEATVDGKLARSTGDEDVDLKYNVGGKNYLVVKTQILDKDLENSDADIADVYGNEVKVVLNKDNTIVVTLIDETSVSAKLYGIIVDGDVNNKSVAKGSKSVTLFTAEGKTVTFDYASGSKVGVVGTDPEAKIMNVTKTELGKLVEYRLNKDNEIKEMTEVGTAFDGTGEIKVKSSAYLTRGKTYKALASNVVIFEVKSDSNGYIDPTIVTRSSLLGGGNFTPGTVNYAYNDEDGKTVKTDMAAYAKFVENNNGAIKVLAYTNATATNLHYGIAAVGNFSDASSQKNDHIMFKGDDTVYDVDGTVKAGQLVIYTLSGTDVTVVATYSNKGSFNTDLAKKVNGNNSGLITFADPGVNPIRKYASDGTYASATEVYDVMTDANTLVFVLDANGGAYAEGSVSDISRGDWAYVPVVDKDGNADVIIVDQFNIDKYNK